MHCVYAHMLTYVWHHHSLHHHHGDPAQLRYPLWNTPHSADSAINYHWHVNNDFTSCDWPLNWSNHGFTTLTLSVSPFTLSPLSANLLTVATLMSSFPSLYPPSLPSLLDVVIGRFLHVTWQRNILDHVILISYVNFVASYLVSCVCVHNLCTVCVHNLCIAPMP